MENKLANPTVVDYDKTDKNLNGDNGGGSPYK